GEVHAAQRDCGAVVALKLIHAERSDDPASVRRFQREGRAALALDHPNVVRTLDAGADGPTHFLVMEYLDGLDAGSYLARKGAMPIAAACEVVRQAALGLQHAHDKGLIHRDVKPSNLMLVRPPEGGGGGDFPTVKILDLGLVRRHALAADVTSELTASG